MPDTNNQDTNHGPALVEHPHNIRRHRDDRIANRDLVLRKLKARYEVLRTLDEALKMKMKEAGK